MKKFFIYNLDAYYSPVDFQTPATPIAEGIFLFAHDQNLMFSQYKLNKKKRQTPVFALDLVQLFLGLSSPFLTRTKVNICTTNNKKFGLGSSVVNKKHLQKNIRCFSTSSKPQPTQSLYLKMKQKKNTLIQRFIANANKEQEYFLFFYNLTLALGISLIVQNFKILGALFGTLFCIFLFYLFMKKVENVIKKHFQEFTNNGVFLALFAFLILSFLLYFQRYLTLGIYIFCAFTYLVFIRLSNSSAYNSPSQKSDKKQRNTVETILADNKIIEYHFNKEFLKFKKFRDFNTLLGLIYCYSLFFKYSDSFMLFSQDWPLMSELFSPVQSILLMFCLLNTNLLFCVRWIIIGHCNPIPESILKSKVLAAVGTLITICFLYRTRYI